MSKTVTITANRYRSFLAAEEFCRAARVGYSTKGVVDQDQYRWFEYWFELAHPGTKYDVPATISEERMEAAKRQTVAESKGSL